MNISTATHSQIIKRKSSGHVLALIIMAFAVSGCASYQWSQPGRSAAQRDADLLACEREALTIYPQRFETVQIEAAKVEPAKTTCTTKGNTQVCITDPARNIPAKYGKQDVNIGQRNEASRLCMGSKGYQWVEVKK